MNFLSFVGLVCTVIVVAHLAMFFFDLMHSFFEY